MHSIFPCFWMNSEAQLAAEFYLQVFPDARVTIANAMVVQLELRGSKFMLLNGGPQFQANPSISNFIYCGSTEEIDRIYSALLPGAKVMMPLGAYPWTSRYAWMTDRFGVSWQLDVDPVRANQKVVPALLFSAPQANAVARAMHHYTTIFNPSVVLMEVPHALQSGAEEGSLLFAQFRLRSSLFNAMSSLEEQDFQFTPGNSLVVECETQLEIDQLWKALGEGGHYQMCGWLVDQFGVSWQIIPSVLPQLLNDEQQRMKVMEALMPLQKLEIATLLEAAGIA